MTSTHAEAARNTRTDTAEENKTEPSEKSVFIANIKFIRTLAPAKNIIALSLSGKLISAYRNIDTCLAISRAQEIVNKYTASCEFLSS